MKIKTYDNQILQNIPWQPLSVEKASRLGLFKGHYIHMITPLQEEFMLVYGMARKAWVTALIANNTAYVGVYNTEGDAKSIAEDTAIQLLSNTCEVAAKNIGLQKQ